MIDIKYWLQTHLKLSFILVACLLAIPAVVIVINKQSDKASSKYVLSKKLNRTDFNVTNTLVDSQGWKLVRIVSTRSVDKGNAAYAIFYSEANQMVLKLGPGTYFSKQSLAKTGMPEDVQEEMLKKLGQRQ